MIAVSIKFDPKIEFEKNYQEYLNSIFRFAYIKTNSQFEAEEITSDVFAKYWQELTKGKDIKNPRAFLYQCARNTVIDFYRKRGRSNVVSSEVVSEPIDENQNLEGHAQTALNMGQIINVLSSLKDEYQTIVVWYYLDELSIPEIARNLHKSEGAVRTTLSRAMEQVRAKVQKA